MTPAGSSVVGQLTDGRPSAADPVLGSWPEVGTPHVRVRVRPGRHSARAKRGRHAARARHGRHAARARHGRHAARARRSASHSAGPAGLHRSPSAGGVGHAGRVARFVAGSFSLFATSAAGVLAFAPMVPAVALGWEPVVVTSGSMQPKIRVGDVVLAQPVKSGAIEPGTVTVFHRPGGNGLVTHRVLREQADGTYVTKGDANAVEDSTPIPRDKVVGAGRVMIPASGWLWLWMTSRDWVALGTAAGVLVAMGWMARYALRSEHDPWAVPAA